MLLESRRYFHVLNTKTIEKKQLLEIILKNYHLQANYSFFLLSMLL